MNEQVEDWFSVEVPLPFVWVESKSTSISPFTMQLSHPDQEVNQRYIGWCDANCTGTVAYFIERNHATNAFAATYYFEDDQDAMHFKLRWSELFEVA